MKILITGANGFIGKNLTLRLQENPDFEVIPFCRDDSDSELLNRIEKANAVIHLAGENRPPSPDAFEEVNVDLTKTLCNALAEKTESIPLLFSSSTQATLDNPYGNSKRVAENICSKLAINNGNPVAIYRLPAVFGKWCKPNYNSVVATFCNNIANELPIQIHDANKELFLVYIDEVVDSFIEWIKKPGTGAQRPEIEVSYQTTVGELADQIYS